MSSLSREANRALRQPVCSQCLLRLSKTRRPAPRWASTAAPVPDLTKHSTPPLHDYFFANDTFFTYAQKGLRVLGAGFWSHNGLRRPAPAPAAARSGAAASNLARAARARALQTSSEATRPALQQKAHSSSVAATAAASAASTSEAAPTAAPPDGGGAAFPTTPDTPSRRSRSTGAQPALTARRRAAAYLALSKPRLTFLMVLTTASAYSLYPSPEVLSAAATASPSLSALTLVFLTTGTALCSASANALNMLMEPAHDAKMSRTRNRPLVRGLISGRGALAFAVAAGALGTAGLYFGVNPTVAFLGAANIALYAGAYTPLKRLSVTNTWVGAVVGAIPPLMGWAAAAGQSAAADGTWRELLLGEQNAGGWLLAALLFAWQFPHFNALSWTIRDEYKAAGYRMMAWVNPRRNARVALRYALLFFPICGALTYVGVTDRGFVVTSSAVNGWIAVQAWRFWRHQGHKGTARALFWAGVWQLPGLLVLAMLHKKGLWDGVWKWATGEAEDDEEPLRA